MLTQIQDFAPLASAIDNPRPEPERIGCYKGFMAGEPVTAGWIEATDKENNITLMKIYQNFLFLYPLTKKFMILIFSHTDIQIFRNPGDDVFLKTGNQCNYFTPIQSNILTSNIK